MIPQVTSLGIDQIHHLIDSSACQFQSIDMPFRAVVSRGERQPLVEAVLLLRGQHSAPGVQQAAESGGHLGPGREGQGHQVCTHLPQCMGN